ncbi:hypothetical protein V6U78_09665 [Marinospirillum sp. MEB164]|uniref:Uncharacterized protein n=1 Tax=Marinospirillum alkalitolerans TaxID=3123374 RepID=A0ABW8PYC5_9GAMM
MKKIATSLLLASCSFGLLADTSLPLASGLQLEGEVLSQIELSDGQRKENVWFSINTSQVQGSSSESLSNCILTSHLSLQQGSLQAQPQQLRCITLEGEVFTSPAGFPARLNLATADVCTSSGASCTQVTLQPQATYLFQLSANTQLNAEYNATRELNRMRLELEPDQAP